jgi:hypothetical protein
MHQDTKAIAFFETNEDAKKAGHTVKLTPVEAVKLLTVPRGDRDKELRNMRKHKRAHQRKERAKARARR